MVHTYIFEPRAMLEYEEAILWYHQRSKQASINFELAVSEKISEICLHPKRYRNTKKHFRETKLKKYPFSIIYFIDEQLSIIVITSIFHSHRNPHKKYTA